MNDEEELMKLIRESARKANKPVREFLQHLLRAELAKESEAVWPPKKETRAK